MTLSTTINKVSYSGTGSQDTFAYTYKIFSSSDIEVYIRNTLGTETKKTITTHYTVSNVGNASGGNIVFTVGNTPLNTDTVIIVRTVPLTQTFDYVLNDPFPSDSHEDGLDKLTMQVQQVKEEVDRSIKASVTNTIASTEFTQSSTDRANKLFGFDSSGNLTISTTLGTNRGNWGASTIYSERDIVKDTSTNNIFQINSGHTSSGSQPLTTNANSAKYTLLVDAATATTAAATATTKAAEASTSATASATSASASAGSATSAAASLDSFTDIYLGEKSSAPTVDNDGDALANGALYWNTSSNLMYAWNGSAWLALADAASVASSAATATTKAGEAATSATASANSAATASGHKDTATTKAAEASSSQTAAASAASTASGHKDTATTKAAEASSSQTAAANSATASATSATASAASATSADTSFDNFNARYLGAKGSAPSSDNDGNTLIAGALYFNSSSNELFVRSSSNTWVQSSFSAAGFMSKASNLGDVASASTSRGNLGLGTAATLTAGTGANNAVQLDGNSKLPAVDGSALTNLPATSGAVSKVADGAIAIRKPIILTSPGKAKQVATTASDATAGVGTALTLDSSVSGSDSRTVLVYMDGIGSGVKTFLKIFCDGGSSNHITAIAFTISDTGERTITAGTPVVVTSNDTATMDAVFDPDTDRVIMVYRNGDVSDQAYYSVISVSGTTVSAGTVATLDNNNSIDARDLAITYDTSADRVAVVYYDQGDSGKIKSYVGTVTGGSTNSVAWGSNVEADGAASNVFTRLCYDVATNRHLLVWRDDNGLQSKVGTLTGSSTNTLAWGSQTTLNTTSVGNIELPMIAYEATQEKCVLGWFSGSSTQKFGVVTVTGASTNTAAIGSLISVTIDYVLHEPNSNALSAIAASKVAYVYNVSDTVKVVPFTISGTSLSAGTAVTVASADTSNIQIAGVVATGAAAITFETNNVSINAIEYRSATISGGGVLSSNLTGANYLGISAAAISDGATGKINVIGGISEGHSSLTIGNHYFTNGAGTIGLVGSATGEQYLGRAISATEIQLLENEGYLYGTAEGAVTAGKPVQVDSDGEFSMIAENSTSYSFAQGSSATMGAVTNATGDIAYNTYTNKINVMQKDAATGHLISYHGTVNGGTTNTVTWGSTTVKTGVTSSCDTLKISYDPISHKTLCGYHAGPLSTFIYTNSSGNSSTAGSTVDATAVDADGIDIVNIGEDKWVVGYQESSDYPAVRVATADGTSLSYGTEVIVNSSSVNPSVSTASDAGYAISYDTTSSQVVVFYIVSNSLYVKVGTVTGTDISFGTGLQLTSGGAVNPHPGSATYVLSKDAHVLAFEWSNDGYVIVVKTSGTGANATVVNAAGSSPANSAVIFDSQPSLKSNVFTAYESVPVVVYSDDQVDINSIAISIDGTTPTMGTDRAIETTTAHSTIAGAYDPDTKRAVIIFKENSDSDLYYQVVTVEGTETTTNMTTDGENYLGIATKTVANDAQVEVATFGQIDAQQSGLTAGQKYFVQSDGSLATSADSSVPGSPGTVTTVAGKALSATKLLITNS